MLGHLYNQRWIQFMEKLIQDFPKNNKDLIIGKSWLEEKLKKDTSPYAFAHEVALSLQPYEKIMKKPCTKWKFLVNKEIKFLQFLHLPPQSLSKREFINFSLHFETLVKFATYLKILNLENQMSHELLERILKSLMIDNFVHPFNFHQPGKQPNFSDIAKLIKRTFTNKTLINDVGEIANHITCGQAMKLAEQFGITKKKFVELIITLMKSSELSAVAIEEIQNEFLSNDEKYVNLTFKELKETFGLFMSTSEIFDSVFNSKEMNIDKVMPDLFS